MAKGMLAPLVMELRARRMERKMFQRELAQKSGYAINTVSMWERGERIPDIRQLEDWASSLGMDIQLVERK